MCALRKMQEQLKRSN